MTLHKRSARLLFGFIAVCLVSATGVARRASDRERASGERSGHAVSASSVKIMPLGDSITFGWRNISYGGYRHRLWSLLQADHLEFDFVGSERSGAGAIPDPENEGHPGWTIQQLQEGIDSRGWLETYQPDVILLHIGTNDIHKQVAGPPADKLSTLLDDILRRLPKARIIVAQIIPYRRGPDPEHQAYNAAIPAIALAKGPRVSVVDMQSILTKEDYGDALHPNDQGYDKMADAWEPAIRAALGLAGTGGGNAAVDRGGQHGEVDGRSPGGPGGIAPSAAGGGEARENARLIFIPSSTVKINQVVGQEDKQLKQATLSQTYRRYGIRGTDLGYSFEDNGRATFLFGDTVGKLGKALDTIAVTDARTPEGGVRLDFLTAPGEPYLTIQPPGVNMGAFNVPVSGVNLQGQTYIVVKTDHSEDKSAPTDRSLLLKFTRPAEFKVLRQISRLPGGRFIKMSMHLQPGPVAGVPAPPGAAGDNPYLFIWGTGVYRASDPYLAIVPAANLESGAGTLYFDGRDSAGQPRWSPNEAEAAPLFANGELGDLSVTWCAPLRLWLMTYDNRDPHRIDFRYAAAPWGPWSDPQTIFDLARDGLGRFIHGKNQNDGLSGPVIGKGHENPEGVQGGAYAPYVVERWTSVSGRELSIYYVLSTWNPYVVVLMRSKLRIE